MGCGAGRGPGVWDLGRGARRSDCAGCGMGAGWVQACREAHLPLATLQLLLVFKTLIYSYLARIHLR